MNLKDFVEKEKFEMQVKDRDPSLLAKMPHLLRWYAKLKGVEILREDKTVISASGNGSTPEEALLDLSSYLSEKKLFLNFKKPNERAVQAPVLDENKSGYSIPNTPPKKMGEVIPNLPEPKKKYNY
jgi:hypothetical protein